MLRLPSEKNSACSGHDEVLDTRGMTLMQGLTKTDLPLRAYVVVSSICRCPPLLSQSLCYTRLENPRDTRTATALRDPARSRMALGLRDLTPPLQKYPYSVSPRYRNCYKLLFLNTGHPNLLLLSPFWAICFFHRQCCCRGNTCTLVSP